MCTTSNPMFIKLDIFSYENGKIEKNFVIKDISSLDSIMKEGIYFMSNSEEGEFETYLVGTEEDLLKEKDEANYYISKETLNRVLESLAKFTL